MPDSFKTRLQHLAFNKKLVFIGSVLMIISVFMPWYKDIDKFKIGESFLGITGPLYLAGFILLISAIISFGIILLKLLDKPAPKLPISENHLHVAVSGLSLLMLIMTVSVYFHTKFGINLTDKSVGFGMVVAFIGSGSTMLGAILSIRGKTVDFENLEGHIEPLININLEERRGEVPLKREVTVGEAMEASRKPQEPTHAWGPVQESINNYTDGQLDDTKDIK